jgi:hypothetical protein
VSEQKPAFTPKPWHKCPAIDFDKMGGPYGHDGMTAVYSPPSPTELEGDSDDWPQLIAYVDGFRGDDNLIAAAPDLYAACVAAGEFIRNGIEFGYIRMPDSDTPDRAHGTLPMLRAAIAKAEGK